MEINHCLKDIINFLLFNTCCFCFLSFGEGHSRFSLSTKVFLGCLLIRFLQNYTHIYESRLKGSKPDPWRRAIAEHFPCGNTLHYSDKTRKSNLIYSFDPSVPIIHRSQWDLQTTSSVRTKLDRNKFLLGGHFWRVHVKWGSIEGHHLRVCSWFFSSVPHILFVLLGLFLRWEVSVSTLVVLCGV